MRKKLRVDSVSPAPPPALAKIFVTRILRRNSFAVANLLLCIQLCGFPAVGVLPDREKTAEQHLSTEPPAIV